MDYYWMYTEPFTENAQKLYDLLYTKEFNAEDLVAQLETGNYSAEDVNAAAFMFVENCCEAENDAHFDHLFDGVAFGALVPGIESSHLVETIKILLDYGLNPNKLFHYDDNGSQTNIMEQMMFVHNGYQSADAAAVMLEHGGNPSLLIDGTSLIRSLNWELMFFMRGDEEFRYFSDSVAHYWMVFIGYGAKLEDGGESVDPFDGFDISNFRNHRQYYYGMVHTGEDSMEIAFFDKDTNREVART